MNLNLEELLAPPLAAVVFGSFAHASFEDGSVTMASVLTAYLIAQGVEYAKKHPIRLGSRTFANETKTPSSTTFLLENDDGFTARVSSKIPFSHFQEIGKVVVDWSADNLTTQIVERALPNKTQAEQRAIHKQIVGLLKPDPIGVIVMKGNHATISYPKGFQFFARVSRGMVSPLETNSIPYTPPQPDRPQRSIFSRHTHATRTVFG